MEKTLEKIISKHDKGLFLLDTPTGFGKTTAVVKLIRRFLAGDPSFFGIKRVFFVTNLITNLPYDELLSGLNDQERTLCLRAKATADYVVERFNEEKITSLEVRKSKECQKLKSDIDLYKYLKSQLQDADKGRKQEVLRKSIERTKQQISTDSEVSFRNLIKRLYFLDKSLQERKEFIKNNEWFRVLYPICEIEKYKVIFLTTKKFVSPLYTFMRMPFYAYNDSITEKSLVFIDEFDSTKQMVLDGIIEDSLKNSIDVVSLYLNLHFALQNFVFPKKLLETSEYHQKRVEEGAWHPTQELFEYQKKAFEEKYHKHEFQYLLKSVGFIQNKAFLFDDGRYFTVIQDSSKKFIYADVNKRDDILALTASPYSAERKPIIKILNDLEYCINGFTEAVFYAANNYWYAKNSIREKEETKFTTEEAIYSVLDVFNLSESEKSYLFNKIQRGNLNFGNKRTEEMRRGFNFIEIEDSNYHDMKSVVHKFDFSTTPEDIIVTLASHALVVGISATAKIKTCIGNYDTNYLEEKLKEDYLESDEEDQVRISESFNKIQNKLIGQYNIHANIIDDFSAFSDREKCEILINKLFDGGTKEKYLKKIEEKEIDFYYYLIELKLAFLYKEMYLKDIYSFIAFVNGFPTDRGKFNIGQIRELFKDIDLIVGQSAIRFEVLQSAGFDSLFSSVKEDLQQGKKVFVLTTYQTIGSGKNIQYKISDSLRDLVVIDENDAYMTKDFEAIYLLTPTNLLQRLSFDSEEKYKHLSNYLFQQEYLFKNGYLTRPQAIRNIANGFRQTFWGETNASFTQNGDLYLHTLKVVIQAIGRICRCRNKNKQIYIYTDKEVVERIQSAMPTTEGKLLNPEFKELHSLNITATEISDKITQYSEQSKRAYGIITNAAYTVRRSKQDVAAWQALRDYVLKNPVTNTPFASYKDLYFEFDAPYSGYSYKQDYRFNIQKISTDKLFGWKQVSDAESELPTILSIGCVKEYFKEKNYCTRFPLGKYIMSPSLFRQVYLGALGEVAGKAILEAELGFELSDIDKIGFYELFDYKLGNFYFDFKHWNTFIKDNDKYVKKVEGKLKKVKGAKCFVINLLKRIDARPKVNIGETVVQIPYLIDGEKETINEEAIDYISQML